MAKLFVAEVLFCTFLLNFLAFLGETLLCLVQFCGLLLLLACYVDFIAFCFAFLLRIVSVLFVFGLSTGCRSAFQFNFMFERGIFSLGSLFLRLANCSEWNIEHTEIIIVVEI